MGTWSWRANRGESECKGRLIHCRTMGFLRSDSTRLASRRPPFTYRCTPWTGEAPTSRRPSAAMQRFDSECPMSANVDGRTLAVGTALATEFGAEVLAYRSIVVGPTRHLIWVGGHRLRHRSVLASLASEIGPQGQDRPLQYRDQRPPYDTQQGKEIQNKLRPRLQADVTQEQRWRQVERRGRQESREY